MAGKSMFRQLSQVGVACGCAGVLAAAMPAMGSVIITDPGTNTLRNNGVSNGGSGGVGFRFTVGASDVEVTALGLYDAPGNAATPNTGDVGDGLETDSQVVIYRVDTDTSGTSVASATVVASDDANAGDTFLVGDFRYINLASSVTLAAGETYEIMVGLGDGGNGYLNYKGGTGATMNSDFTINTGSSTTDTTGGYYNNSGTTGSAAFAPTNSGHYRGDSLNGATGPFVGPNFQYGVVPEPASLALLGLSGLVMLSRERRRNRSQ